MPYVLPKTILTINRCHLNDLLMYIYATTNILLEPFGLEIDFVLMEYKSNTTEVRMTESRTLHVASISPRARFVFVKRNDVFAVHTCRV